MRHRVIKLWDARNLGAGCIVEEKVDSNMGVPLICFDADSEVLVFSAKGGFIGCLQVVNRLEGFY